MTQGAYAAVNGIDLYYEIHGAEHPGPPLIMLHGGAYTFHLSFGAVLGSLSAERKVIGVELQGHGHTADSDRPFTIRQCAEDVITLLDQLNIDQADFFGFSLGGLTATEVAVRAPERVRRLVLAASHFGRTRSVAYYSEITDVQLDSPRMPTEEQGAAMIRAYTEVAPNPDGFYEFVPKAQSEVHDFEGWSNEQLARLTMPILIIIGDTDFVRLEHAVDMKQSVPNAQLAILPGTTHLEVIRPDLVLPMVSAFLAQ
ncbi:alpha/beta fold hydrolase [Jiangella alkaliphila]|uniref:Pimeloyl-ACP methyl ester carboxylesterase n=2 Tax=Jiangella alkaliphila TaxID=419479 RepID=A0A1H2HPS9_9ACTN|nr:alpha/beta hydrolase [Jiangella alkaliphila]SDU33863.1 Pimeloyl-ACP methyl ester carboxylesterase [Jiangella alkaliphila]